MSTDIAESLPKRKFAQAAIANAEAPKAPKGKKGGGKKGGKPAPEAKGGGGGKGASEEGSEKRIRQAVYDIRYRARREDIDLKAAFAQYMSNSSLSQGERSEVRAKLFGKAGGMTEKFTVGAGDWASDNVANALYQVFVERDKSEELKLAYLQQLDEDEDNRKYKVRVTDKNGRAYVRFADRAKITELRQNPNIESVEMTDHGEPYEGERRKGRMTARAKQGKRLDPVGKEDADVDNDGDVDKSDKYLLKRRKAIGKAIRTRAEAYLIDGTTTTEPGLGTKKITGKGVDNYATGAVKVSPDDGQTDPAVKPKGVYSHFNMQGLELTESQRKLFEMMKKKEEDKKDELENMATKDMSKGSCPPDEEKEDDNRDKYAKINVIKNKLRSMGKRDPQVMVMSSPTKGQKLNMYGEENISELRGVKLTPEDKIRMEKNKKKKPSQPSSGESRYHTGHPVKVIDGKPTKMMPNKMPSSYYGGQENKDKYQKELDKLPNPQAKKNKGIPPIKKRGAGKAEAVPPIKKRGDGKAKAVPANTERTPAKDDPAFDNMRKKTKNRIEKTKKPYNPYPKAPKGEKQATPSNMAPGRP